jgi:hypothetical protein
VLLHVRTEPTSTDDCTSKPASGRTLSQWRRMK